jgi:3-(3-hydroxy-phenyl)propionate hydroxylase
LSRRYALALGDVYVLRPDGHVAARFHDATRAEIAAAIERLEGRQP